ncbi:carotenoid biosynthesis protein [Cohnella abietis]|uniref:Carotenoid biosynthesis protein n=1 Tax=Cohnella abietis TaxID=2507935 RepID=A0A3T1D6E0_9BACL|nr:carotenoid biosynthesis protein [Cohnella abietis]BBI33633.1 hypothetical protein KCTCHS21_30320 [Cohnella abietis]
MSIRMSRSIRLVFLGWYTVGLALMLSVGVPDSLGFANGIFLLLYAIYAVELYGRAAMDERKLWARVIAVGVITFFVEWIGVRTSWPFGDYSYTPLLGWALDGVPIAIACAWVGVLLNGILLSDGHSRWKRALHTGLWTVLIDLVLDPVAFVREMWIWTDHEGVVAYLGVPINNFISWFLLSALLSLVFPLVKHPRLVRREAARLMQLILLMFGVLGIKDGLIIPLAIALIGAAVAEGVARIDTSTKKLTI